MPVEIIIADAYAHARLLHPVFAESNAAEHSFFAESSIMVVHEQKTGSRVTGDVDVLPTVFIKIRRHNGHAITGRGFGNSGLLRHIGESSVAVVSIQGVLASGQPPRPALDGNPFPPAVDVFAGGRCIFKRKANVVGNEEVQVSIAVVVHEAAAGAKPWLVVRESGGFGHVGESSVAVVSIESVLPEIGAKDVVKAVVVVVAYTNPAGPADRVQAGFLGDIRERPVAVVLVQPIRRAFGSASQARAAENKQIHPPVIVIINERAAASGGFHDVLFDLFIAIAHRRVQSGGSGYIHEVSVERAPGQRGSRQGLGGMGRNALPQQADRTQPERAAQPESEKTTAVEVHGPRNLRCFKLLKLFMLSRVNQRLRSSPRLGATRAKTSDRGRMAISRSRATA